MSGLELQTTPIGLPPAVDLAAVAAVRRPISRDLRDAFLAEGAAAAQLDRLFTDGALCVTTGQQPGLLTGPLYTLYKGLSTVALAQRCESLLGRPVVPVFWVAGDDHDFTEANHAHLLTTNNEVKQLTLRGRREDAPLTPLYREPVGPEIADVLRAVEELTPPTEFRPDVLEWLRRHYRPAADLATAFAGAVAELMGRFGLVVFRPTHAAAKQVTVPPLLLALERAAELAEHLVRRAAQLRAAGHDVPVHVADGATLVMLEAGLGRDRLVRDGDAFVTRRSGERYTLDDLRALAERQPTSFSPNVLLRPVIEAGLLPTLAYVAGPGELKYFPQCDPVYDALAVVPQARVARWSGRIIESRVHKVLDKYGITPDALHAPEGQLEQSLIRDEMPAEARDALRTLRETLDREYARLQAAGAAVDQTLRKPVESSRNQALAGLNEIEKRILSHLKQQNEVVMQQIAKARHNLFPLGQPQERVFTALPYLIRYGQAFLDAVESEATAWMNALEPVSAGP